MRTLQADLATFTSDPEDVDSASSLRTGHYSSTRRRSAEAGEETQRTHAGGRADPPHAGSNLILVVCGYFSVITAPLCFSVLPSMSSPPPSPSTLAMTCVERPACPVPFQCNFPSPGSGWFGCGSVVKCTHSFAMM